MWLHKAGNFVSCWKNAHVNKFFPCANVEPTYVQVCWTFSCDKKACFFVFQLYVQVFIYFFIVWKIGHPRTTCAIFFSILSSVRTRRFQGCPSVQYSRASAKASEKKLRKGHVFPTWPDFSFVPNLWSRSLSFPAPAAMMKKKCRINLFSSICEVFSALKEGGKRNKFIMDVSIKNVM